MPVKYSGELARAKESIMKCFSWITGRLAKGIELKADEKFGQVVYLGEAGRGRRYEKVSLGRRNPAEVVSGRVLEAHPVKITLPVKDGKPEKVFFFVLEQPTATQSVLVRINSNGGYIRGGCGGWNVMAGSPVSLISGYGAFGDAGRVGSWNDGLVVMNHGDVIQVHTSRAINGTRSFALWISADGQPQTANWQDWENLQAVAKAEAVIAEAEATTRALPTVFGSMSCFTFASGQLKSGIKVERGTAGPAVRMGETGRGRKLVDVSLIGFDTELVEASAVVKLGDDIFGLVQSGKSEPNAHLVRVCTNGGYTRRGDGYWEIWKGQPEVVTYGNGADGDAGRIGSWLDGLIVLRTGDVLRIRPSSDGPAFALFVEGNELRVEDWLEWKVQDAQRDPDFYTAKGTAPWGCVPTDWVGRIVTTIVRGERTISGGHRIPAHHEGETGELISISPLVLNLGWDGRDRHDMTVPSALFLKLETDKKVSQLEGEELAKRQAFRKEAETLRDQAREIIARSHFRLLESNLREQVEEVAKGETFDTMPTVGYRGLDQWSDRAKQTLAGLAKAEPEVMELEKRQNSGEVLVDFGGWVRTGGRTNCAQYWVICPDGSEREPDHRDYNHPRGLQGGHVAWRLVEPDELAILWRKDFTSSPHEFMVGHRPVNGCTQAQLDTVERLEREIFESWDGATGMSGKVSPDIGNGWGLHEVEVEPEPATLSPDETEPLSGESLDQALDALRAKFNSK
jgi:hypothetical protein